MWQLTKQQQLVPANSNIKVETMSLARMWIQIISGAMIKTTIATKTSMDAVSFDHMISQSSTKKMYQIISKKIPFFCSSRNNWKQLEL